jgi:hypothetical protein
VALLAGVTAILEHRCSLGMSAWPPTSLHGAASTGLLCLLFAQILAGVWKAAGIAPPGTLKWHGALGPVLFYVSLAALATGALEAFHGTATCLMLLVCSAGLGLAVAEWRGDLPRNLGSCGRRFMARLFGQTPAKLCGMVWRHVYSRGGHFGAKVHSTYGSD